MNLTQLRFKGFLETPFLWNDSLLGIKQFEFVGNNAGIDQKISDTKRLGNYVEELVSFQLKQDKRATILRENIQIIEEKTTLGELDCLLTLNNQPIHLEIAYKFYLYDQSVGNNFLEHWIGPNRRDSLMLKMKKMKKKQFPLLFHKACENVLKELNLQANDVTQIALFRAQLFIPLDSQEIEFNPLNRDCVQGFYMNLNQFKSFSDSKFYIPKKLDWLIQPHPYVDWLNYQKTIDNILEFFKKQSAPLLWMKSPNGELKKLFVTWW